MSTLYLIDGYAQFFRAYYAIRTPMHSAVLDEPTHMTYGFVGMLLKLLREEKPDHLAVVIDVSGDRGTFRSELYSDYKANRDPPPADLAPQVQRCLGLLELLGVPVIGLEGVEADDVIATIVRRMRAEHADDLEIRIVSKDKDLQQLLDEHTALVDVHKGETYGVGTLLEEKGITPAQVIDMLALMGDTVDNVPGVPGIGPKTASKLIAEHGSIDGLLANIESIKGKRRESIEGARDTLALSRELVTLKDDCDVAFDLEESSVDLSKIDGPPVAEALRELGFNRLRDELTALLGGSETGGTIATEAAVAPASMASAVEADDAMGTLFATSDEPAPRAARPVDGTYHVIRTREALDALVARLATAPRIAVDCETDGLVAPVDPLAGICLAIEPGEGFYVPVNSPEPEEHLDRATVIDALRPVLENPAIGVIGHNLKFDLNALRNAGIRVASVAGDTMIESYVADAARASHAMDALSEALLGRRCVSITEVIGKGKSQRLFSEAPLDVAGPYAAEDADVTLRLDAVLRPKVDELGLATLYEETELPLVEVLAEIEFNGIRVDADELDRQRARLESRIVDVRDAIAAAAPHPFNPDSPKQLSAALFNAPDDDPPGLGLKPLKKTKTGASTNAEVLKKLAEDPAIETPIPAMIVEYRQLTKLVGTYLVALKEAIQPSTGRIHASFNQTVAETGRLSSSQPNLQNIPIRTDLGREIRKAFVADDGHLLLAADYSQIELRMLAHLSGDEGLAAAFRDGVDIHVAVASEVLGVEPEAVDSEMRTTAKMINFGIVYGITPFGLARRLGGGVGVEEAKRIIQDYRARFTRIAEFLEECVDQAKSKGFVETILGRRRAIPQIVSRNPAERALGERMAINSVVQGSAADLIKRAMIDLHRALPEHAPDTRMLLQIHDELVFEVPDARIDAVRALVVDRMEHAMTLTVPLEVTASHGRDWYAAK